MHEPQLARRLGLISAISITVGGVIGSGIFYMPLEIAQSLPSELAIHATWIALGLVCLFGAFAYAELGAMYPEAGGQYAFLREGWGRFIAFLFGWTFLLVISTGTMAALAAAFADAVAELTPMDEWAKMGVAAAMILALAVVNHFGVKAGALVQDVSTFAKLAALGAIVIAGLLLAGGTSVAAPHAAETAPAPTGTLAGVVAASMAIFWAYEGWYQLPFNAAELKRPDRDLPRGLIWGVLILIVTYVVVNATYLHVVPLDEMRSLERKEQVPMTAVGRVFGGDAGTILALLIALSVLGAANPSLLSSPRGFYAMAKDGLMAQPLLYVHPRWRTPTVAIWVLAVWAVFLVWVMEKQFHDLTNFVVFAALLFYALTVASVYVLRRRVPHAARPYRCTGYPLTPALFILVVLFVDVQVLLDPEQRRNALYGLAIIATGVPVYLFATLRRRRPAA